MQTYAFVPLEPCSPSTVETPQALGHQCSPTGTSTMNQQHSSLLVTLPPELRNMIYDYAIRPEHPIDLRHAAEPALTRSCKLLRQETLPIYHGCIDTFELNVTPTSHPAVVTCVQTAPRALLDRIQTLTVKWTSGHDRQKFFNSGTMQQLARALCEAGFRNERIEWAPVRTGGWTSENDRVDERMWTGLIRVMVEICHVKALANGSARDEEQVKHIGNAFGRWLCSRRSS